jgi:hypothetical protein
VPFTLVTPAGNITFNAGGDGFYLSDIQGLDGAPLRKSSDPLPQTDASLVRRGVRSGKTVTLRGQILANGGFTVRRGLEDTLRGYLDRLVRPTAAELVSSCRLRYTPSGYSDERMLDAVELLEPVKITGTLLKEFEFTLASPYPYSKDLTQITTTIAAGGSATVTNAGNTPSYPVLQVAGSFTTATIANTTTGLAVVFTAGVVGGHYAEVDTLKKTVYTDGSGANLLGNLNFASSTFWQLLPGANTVTATGAAVTVLSNNAWA